MLSMKDNAIQELDTFKPRAYGGGIRTAKMTDIANQKEAASKLNPILLKNFTNDELNKTLQKQFWITLAAVAGLMVAAYALLKYKIIQL